MRNFETSAVPRIRARLSRVALYPARCSALCRRDARNQHLEFADRLNRGQLVRLEHIAEALQLNTRSVDEDLAAHRLPATHAGLEIPCHRSRSECCRG